MSIETFPHRIFLFTAALTIAGALTGCASQESREPNRLHPVDTTPKHWWESDMDNQDRSFFLGSFFNQDH